MPVAAVRSSGAAAGVAVQRGPAPGEYREVQLPGPLDTPAVLSGYGASPIPVLRSHSQFRPHRLLLHPDQPQFSCLLLVLPYIHHHFMGFFNRTSLLFSGSRDLLPRTAIVRLTPARERCSASHNFFCHETDSRLMHPYRVGLYFSARTGGHRRMIKTAGRRVPCRVSACIFPAMAIDSNNSYRIPKNRQKSLHVGITETEKNFANRAAAFRATPWRTSFRSPLVQKF
jgi:hypothetical protein